LVKDYHPKLSKGPESEIVAKYIAEHSQTEIDYLTGYLFKALGHVYRLSGIDAYQNYGARFDLPGYSVSPNPSLSQWFAANWGNFDFGFELLRLLIKSSKIPITNKFIYFISYPPLKGTIIPELTTCPLLTS